MSNPITISQFGPVLHLRCWPLLLPLDLHFRVCCKVSIFPSCISTHIFCKCTNAIIRGAMLVSPTQYHTMVTYTLALVRTHVLINSILFDNKHHYRYFNNSFNNFWLAPAQNWALTPDSGTGLFSLADSVWADSVWAVSVWAVSNARFSHTVPHYGDIYVGIGQNTRFN